MITENTLLILGAGASKPYGYPTGPELRSKIINDFRNQYHINTIRYLKTKTQREDYISIVNKFISTFDFSDTKSIDLFLSRNPKFLQIGKLAITLSIYDSELRSISRESVDKNENWYSYLFDRLTTDFTKPDQYKIANNNLHFLTFNYDRSFDNHLYDSMINSFSEINKNLIEEEVIKIKPLHLFGSISSLPWQEEGGFTYKKNGILFNDTNSNIEIIYNKSELPNIEEAKQLIKNAKSIFFLGFGYAKENLEILDFPNIIAPNQKIYGTTLNLESREVNDIYEKYFSTDKIPIKNVALENCNSKILLQKYL